MKQLSKWLAPAVAIIAIIFLLLEESGVIHPESLVSEVVAALLVIGLVAGGWIRRSLTSFIFIGMLAGVLVGQHFPLAGSDLKVLSDIFLRLVKCIIAPLLIGTLVVGIAGHSDLKQIGRMGVKALLYFEVVTTLALFIGLAAINISKAGEGIHKPEEVVMPEALKKATEKHFDIREVFPENIAKSIAEGNVLQVVVFALLFGIALSMIGETHRHTMLHFFEVLNEVMFRFTNLVMYAAPLAVFGALSFTVSTMGLGVFKNFAVLIITLLVALAVFVAAVLLPIMWWFKIKPREFFHAIHEPVSVAFATASSDAALPKAMKAMEHYGVPKKVYSFVLPLGYSFNLDGTTLYLSLALIFVAQAGGVSLTLSQQLYMMLTLMLSSKGVAGVAKASFVILYGTVAMFHLPEWPVFLVFAADAVMDMARTAVNVIGNCLATVVISKSEN
ncbi:MAG: dicarboxylate/amino acid:cation symporter [Chitinophagales bacterium]